MKNIIWVSNYLLLKRWVLSVILKFLLYSIFIVFSLLFGYVRFIQYPGGVLANVEQHLLLLVWKIYKLSVFLIKKLTIKFYMFFKNTIQHFYVEF